MSERKREDLIDTIQRLLALSGSPNENEAKAALAKAQKLMIEHSLSMAEVESAEVEKADWIEEQAWEGNHLPFEQEFVVMILREFFFVCPYWEKEKRGRGLFWRRLKLFGRADQLPVARHVFVYMTRTFRRLWNEYKVTLGRYSYADTRAYAAGLYDGFAAKLTAERRVQVVRVGKSNALVVVTNALVEAFESGPGAACKIRKGSPVRGSAEAYSQGVQDGRRISIYDPLGQPFEARPALSAR